MSYLYAKEYSSTIKKNEIMSSAATWLDLDIVTEWNKSIRKRKIIYDIAYMKILHDTNDLIYKIEKDSQI